MIKTESMIISGKAFVRTYSDSGYKVERDGVCYDEAIDLAELGRVYQETDEPVEGYTEEPTPEDYEAALAEMGVRL